MRFFTNRSRAAALAVGRAFSHTHKNDKGANPDEMTRPSVVREVKTYQQCEDAARRAEWVDKQMHEQLDINAGKNRRGYRGYGY